MRCARRGAGYHGRAAHLALRRTSSLRRARGRSRSSPAETSWSPGGACPRVLLNSPLQCAFGVFDQVGENTTPDHDGGARGPVFPRQQPTVYRPYTGLFEKVVGGGMSVLCGAGVGGSTLVYAGAWTRPDEAVFSRLLPSVDYVELDRVHLPQSGPDGGYRADPRRRAGAPQLPGCTWTRPAAPG